MLVAHVLGKGNKPVITVVEWRRVGILRGEAIVHTHADKILRLYPISHQVHANQTIARNHPTTVNMEEGCPRARAALLCEGGRQQARSVPAVNGTLLEIHLTAVGEGLGSRGPKLFA